MKILIIIVLLFTSVLAFSVQTTYTQEEKEACEKEGGCRVISRKYAEQLMQYAYQRGQATCESKL
jgi:hypothetical protein